MTPSQDGRVSDWLCAAFQSHSPANRFAFRFGEHAVVASFSASIEADRWRSAVAHLQVPFPGTGPFLEIIVTSPEEAPPFPWNGDRERLHYDSQGKILSLSDERIVVYRNTEASIVVMDLSRRLACYLVEEAGDLPYWEFCFPFRLALHWSILGTTRQILHASAVGNGRDVVLFAGKGGAGKSTTALLCLAEGLKHLGDDYVLIETDGVPRAFTIYNTAKLHQANFARVPEMKDWIENPGRLPQEKGYAFLHKWASDRIQMEGGICAILLPEVVRDCRDTIVTPATSADVVRLVAPSTAFQLPGGIQETLEKTTTLAARCRSFRLCLGSDLEQIPEAIRNVLQRTGAFPPKG